MAERYTINRDGVFAPGFSMGEMMCYILAYTSTRKIATIAPVANIP